MPIIAILDTPTSTPVVDNGPTCRLDFAALDGSELIVCDSEVWINRRGTTGIDLTPRELVTDRIIGLPGGRIAQINDLPKDVVTPLMVRPESGQCWDMRAQIARLRTVLDYRRVDYAANDGHADIIATTDEGVTRRLRVAYVDGAEG